MFRGDIPARVKNRHRPQQPDPGSRKKKGVDAKQRQRFHDAPRSGTARQRQQQAIRKNRRRENRQQPPTDIAVSGVGRGQTGARQRGRRAPDPHCRKQYSFLFH